ncbi:hypothetical protein [Streptomyces sp. NPDC055299]
MTGGLREHGTGHREAGVIDATTPVAPDDRGRYSQPVTDLPETAEWAAKLHALRAAL